MRDITLIAIILVITSALSLSGCGKLFGKTSEAAAAEDTGDNITTGDIEDKDVIVEIESGFVEETDDDGVAAATCPDEWNVTGGGCECDPVYGVIFGATPAGNAYICGCTAGPVTATVVCVDATHDTVGSVNARVALNKGGTPNKAALRTAHKFKKMLGK